LPPLVPALCGGTTAAADIRPSHPERYQVMSRDRYRIYEKDLPHFITSSFISRRPLLKLAEVRRIIFDSLRFLQDEDGLAVYAYVLMPDHFHLIASAPDLPRALARFKSYTARRIVDRLRERGDEIARRELAALRLPIDGQRQYQVWIEGYHSKQNISAKMMRQKIRYIHYNPVRKGLVLSPEQWLYSSAGDYAGRPGPLKVTVDW